MLVDYNKTCRQEINLTGSSFVDTKLKNEQLGMARNHILMK